MFDRFVRLTQARRALTAGRPEEALRLVMDPLLANQRRGEDVRAAALTQLLDRARQRAARGDLRGAIRDADAVLSWQRDHAGAAGLLAELNEQSTLTAKADATAKGTLQEVQALVEGGDLAAAEIRLAAAREPAPGLPKADVENVLRGITNRRAAAREHLEQARRTLRAGEPSAALDHARQAGALDRHAEGLVAVRSDIAAAFATTVVATARAALKRQDLACASRHLAHERAMLPELAELPQIQALHGELRAALRRDIDAHLRAGQLHDAIAQFQTLDPRLGAEPWLGELAAAIGDLRDGLAAAAAGASDAAATHLGRAADSFPCAAVQAARDAAAAEAAAINDALGCARRHVTDGDLGRARQTIETALARWPLARQLREEMKVLEESAMERQRRLAAARQAAQAGRLREACAQALALACPGSLGDEARRLHAEVQARLDVVASGIDQVRRAVHGRVSASVEGLAHCVARLDELARAQSDHEDLERLRAALVVERDGLLALAELGEASRARKVNKRVIELAHAIVQQRPNLLALDRLDARLLAAMDALQGRCETEISAGRLRDAQVCADALEAMARALPAEAARVETLRARIAANHAAAGDAVVRVRAAIAQRDLEGADAALEAARQSGWDDDQVAAAERELHALRAQMREADAVQALTERRDFASAHDRLATLPPTSAAMRTKIFDLKRSLAHAQGLDGGFVLRVDEGGEFLVVRRDSLSIGNLRDGRADLVILANIAGQHARLQRRMSFHGGMEDRILAERGPVTVNGVSVREQRLRDDDEVGLGGQLRLRYKIPSTRSLTTSLFILGGFQIRGTDKVLLLKDRGRDGRILIGNSKDAHVPVPVEGPEVELFAGLDGQVRVRCERNGTIDGKPFVGEHPVLAGATVVCGGIAFVLLPLPPT
jgi:hypothetical protein